MYTKKVKEKFLKSYIVLLSYQPTSTGQLAQLGQMVGAGWLVTQKDNVGFQKIFFPCFVYRTHAINSRSWLVAALE